MSTRVEQILSERRGPAPARQRVLFWDIETAPMLAYIWQARTEYVGPHLITHDTFMLSWAAKWEDRKRVYSGVLTGDEAAGQDDSRIVADLAALVREADVVVAHNGDRFDVKKLNSRLAALQQEPLGSIRTIDTLTLAKRSFSFASNSLDYLARMFDVRRKLSTGGFDLWKACYRGDEDALKKMDRYCRGDVRVLQDVYEAMAPYVKGLPRLVDAAEPDQHACPSCGSGQLERDGVYRTNASTFPKWICISCERPCRGRQADSSKKLALVPLA